MTDQEHDLLAGLRAMDRRQTSNDALQTAALLATYLRLLGAHAQAATVQQLVRQVCLPAL